MNLAIVLITFGCILCASACGTEIGNGDKQDGRTDDEGSSAGDFDPATDKENQDKFNVPANSPYIETGATTIPVLGAFTNYCNGPSNELSASPETFKGGGLVLSAKQFEVKVSYPSGHTETVSGTSNANFTIGLPTYSCDAFSQKATQTIDGFDGSFTKKSQVMISPESSTLTITWYTDESTGTVARVEFVDAYGQLVLDNDAY